tara:strand:+ start:169 stop:495 length:327 start_codon:yes stop_codon:yes gene_type:complete
MKISIEAFCGDPEDISTDNLASSFIKSLLEILSEIPAKHQESAAIEFRSYGDDDYAIMEITYFREETEEELAAKAGKSELEIKRNLEQSQRNVLHYEQKLKALKGGSE